MCFPLGQTYKPTVDKTNLQRLDKCGTKHPQGQSVARPGTFQQNPFKIGQGEKHGLGDLAGKFCNDWYIVLNF